MNPKKTILIAVAAVLLASAFGISLMAAHSYNKKADLGLDALLEAPTRPSDLLSSAIPGEQARDHDDADSAKETHASSAPAVIKSLSIEGKKLKDQSSKTFIVAFVGDQGLTSGSHQVMRLVKGESADALAVLGDYDYADNPSEWMKLIESELGNSFPLIPVIGNHDELKWAGYSSALAAHMQRTPSVECQGAVAIKSLCRFKDLRMFIVAPGIASIQASGKEYADFIKESAQAAQSSSKPLSSTWNICAWHKNQKLMQLGGKGDETGWDTYNACLSLGFPIMTAHEHSYARSFLLSDLDSPVMTAKETTVLPDLADPDSAAPIDQLSLAPGKTFVTVSGLGGQSIRPQDISNPWWSSAYTSSQQAKFGALFCAFNYKGDMKKALCYMKNVDGEIVDAFIVKR